MSDIYSTRPPGGGEPEFESGESGAYAEPLVGVGASGSSTAGASGTSGANGRVADTAKHEATHVGKEATQAAGHVAGTAKEEGAGVAREAKNQAKDLFNESKRELTEQASKQQQRAADGLRSLSDEFHSMAHNSSDGGMASQLVSQAGERAGAVASWLDNRDPGSLVDEVRNFARRRPGVFIGLAAGAGILVGRLTRSIIEEESPESSALTTRGTSDLSTPRTTPVTPASPTTRPAPSTPVTRPAGAHTAAPSADPYGATGSVGDAGLGLDTPFSDDSGRP